MKVLIVVPPENFRDEELAGPIAEFEKAGIQYDIASTKKGVCRGMLGARATASLSLEEVDPSGYSGIVLIGGSGSPVHLWNSDLLVQLVKYFSENNKLVAAICLSPVVLARAGILKGKKATCFDSPPATKEMIRAGADLSAGPVVKDGTVAQDFGVDFSGWHGRVCDILQTEEGEPRIHVIWDSLTLRILPIPLIEACERRGRLGGGPSAS